jgi:group I intron endonuclease
MRHGSVYIATNKHTGEQYVGQTRQLVQKRWAANWRTASCATSRKAKFQKALNAFGRDAFLIDEVFVAFSADALNDAEISLIAELQPAYNSSRGGKGLRPIIVSEETKRKRSEAAKARWANPEWKAKAVASLRESHNTEAAKFQARNLAAMKVGTKASEETKRLISKANVRRNQDLVAANSAKAIMIHTKCTQGAPIDVTCAEHGMSRHLFYSYVKRLRLPLFGHKPRRVCFDL